MAIKTHSPCLRFWKWSKRNGLKEEAERMKRWICSLYSIESKRV